MKQNWNSWTNRKVEAPQIVIDFNQKIADGFGVRGNGRSYGDACLNDRLISMLNHRRVLNIENGILRASSGFLLNEALELCVQNGFFIPVIPGTQYVTIGGMIAADVHGKNHAQNGTIGRWIKSFKLLLPSNKIVVCSPTENTDLFNATIGGMGLTGIIVEAEIQLEQIKGTQLKQQCSAPTNLNQLLDELTADENDFSVGWMDCLNPNRFLLFSANFDNDSNTSDLFKLTSAKWKVPNWNIKWFSTRLMKWYNKRYFKKNLDSNGSLQSIADYFFPLDSIQNWNRLYGKNGFYQYQFVVTEGNALLCIEKILDFLRFNNIPPYLCVIKKHGELTSPGLLSFPIKGYSIALDMPYQDGLLQKMQELDQLLLTFGGRVYLAKDGHLSDDSFKQMYPKSDEYKSIVATVNKGEMTTTMAKRLNLITKKT